MQELYNFFSTMDFQVFQTVALFVLVAFLVGRWLLRWLFKAFKNRTLKKIALPGGISAEFEDEIPREERRKNPHMECVHNVDVFQVITKILTTMPIILRIDLRDILEEQMNYADEQIFLLKDKFTDALVDLLKRKQVESEYVSSNIIYKVYNFMLTIFLHKMVDKTRTMLLSDEFRAFAVRENQVDFIRWIEDKIARIRVELNTFFNTEFFNVAVLSKIEIKRMHDATVGNCIATTWEDIFERARAVLLSKTKEKKELEDDMYSFIRARIGDTPGGA